MAAVKLPTYPEQLTPEFLTTIISERIPGTRVEAARLMDARRIGDEAVSSSQRAWLEVDYAPGSPEGLPRHLFVKLSPGSLFAIYDNEINFYNRIRPGLDIETPMALGGRADPATRRFVLITEDLTPKGAHFCKQSDEPSVKATEAILDNLARLHAAFWDSPRFQGDLSFVQTHLNGSVEDLMHGLIRNGIRQELEKEVTKRELLGRLCTTEEEMYAGVCALKRHQATLPLTLLQGDCHFANSYLLPDGRGGIYDWQLCVRGYAMHDISYMVTTSLSIALRRQHERELLAFYRDCLGRHGVASPPDVETLWLEYRRAALWNLYYGWLIAPVSYGWELLTLALMRTSAAIEDHETLTLLKALQ